MNVRIFLINFIFASLYSCIANIPAYAQNKAKQLIRVEQMDYVFDPQIAGTFANRVILPTDTIIAEQMKQSFVNAINNKWDAELLNADAAWNLKRLGSMRNLPKFKPTLKSADPGTWHLFFQVFDNGPYAITGKSNLFALPPLFESLDHAPYNLLFKAILLDGATGNTIFSNEMHLEMKRTTFPESQLLLRKVPGMASSFISAFDSAVKVFFGNTSLTRLTLPLAPAFVYMQFDSITAKAIPLHFKISGDTLVEEPTLRQRWVIKKVSTIKLDKKERLGTNFLGGAFTSLTGLSTDRVKLRKYLANIDYYDNFELKTYQCKVTYFEEQREERTRNKIKNSDGSKSVETNLSDKATRRYIDADQRAFVMSGSDTVGNFHLKFGVAKDFVDPFTQCWDGRDSATITNMPEYWNNASAAAGIGMAPVSMEGNLYGKPFVIQTSKGGNQYDLLMEGQLVATLSVQYDRPTRGFLFVVPEDMKVLKVMCMLTALPFSDFQ